MPKVVDHEARKEQIIARASTMIAEQGYDRLTMRALAADMDITTGMITHYYKSKDDILFAALQGVHDRFYTRASSAIGGRKGLEAIRARMQASLPLSPSVRQDWAIIFQFWASATRKPEFARYMSKEHKRLQAMDIANLEYAQAHGEIGSHLVLERVAEQLDAMTTGIGVSSRFNARRLNKRNTFEIIDDALSQLANK